MLNDPTNEPKKLIILDYNVSFDFLTLNFHRFKVFLFYHATIILKTFFKKL